MDFLRIIFIFSFGTSVLLGQSTIQETLETYNTESVPYRYSDMVANASQLILLDTRAKTEFEVSHLKGAIWVGYLNFDAERVQQQLPDKTAPIVVYCSIGVRSEEIGEKLMQLGYTQITNLYGGIFEWKNKGNPVYDMDGNETDKVHAFDREWGKLLKKGKRIHPKNP
ncbi:rhodanese-like domain-containing protein [Maribacter sp. 2-571]|uniref:rhodanese-like domain-containing protein n=1 Tax=Maribacter sp. 2-571 TaxID=3417569 RepID=UPI003D34E2DB